MRRLRHRERNGLSKVIDLTSGGGSEPRQPCTFPPQLKAKEVLASSPLWLSLPLTHRVRLRTLGPPRNPLWKTDPWPQALLDQVWVTFPLPRPPLPNPLETPPRCSLPPAGEGGDEGTTDKVV